MIKIGLTGSIASGKTTASQIISRERGVLFSADKIVKKLYQKNAFKKLAAKKLNIHVNKNLKKEIKNKILQKKGYLKKLEKIIHPLVRKEMRNFTSQNKNKKFLFYEIPLLIESKLMKYFNIVIFIKAKKQLRLRRFQSKSGDKKLFNILNDKQMSDKNKIKYCDFVIVNEKNLNILKKNLLAIIDQYE